MWKRCFRRALCVWWRDDVELATQSESTQWNEFENRWIVVAILLTGASLRVASARRGLLGVEPL
jgi:hypothetical protein